jgi:hypothetical protein
MDCVEELAKSPVAKISISRAEPDLRGPVGAPSGNDRSLRIAAGWNRREAVINCTR